MSGEDEQTKEITLTIPLGAIIAGVLALLFARRVVRWRRAS